MEPFIRSDQFHFIKSQVQILTNGHASVSDIDVLQALKSLAKEKIFALFPNMTDEQEQVLTPILTIEEKAEGEAVLAQLKPYVMPFPTVTEQTLKKLFPKAKKLKTSFLKEVNWEVISYLSWEDLGSNKRFIVTPYNNKLMGIHGTFNPITKKSICALCHQYEEVGMFMIEVKGPQQGTFVKRGNYICQDQQACNENITTLDQLHNFIARNK
ncbi:FusB/FusC family EF-G-binding protein [Bacillus sp. FJAT-42315]|uniref:FusB/FusC family EF-G-binding protein n=1 Tax=Bacillus sp. FJAT-42315 TaxID=2014077 RepID=UPI000BA92003|nr:FusB/FusC family EF-G-binding protein [Bacillus sp. FJAT-42315]PAQ16122.1 elongation factor G-binding protein [Bacillaceae bacterium SAOS 7]